MTKPRVRFSLAIFVLAAGFVASTCYADQISIETPSGEELVAERYPADGDYLILWFAPEYGFRSAHHMLADDLARDGVEVWLTNIPESLFMPNGVQSIRQLDGRHVADLIEYAFDATGKRIALAGDSYGSVVALVGASRWQQRREGDSYVIGAVLFSPYAYASVPPLGELPEYLPIVSATNIPIVIYQTTGSAIFSQFDDLLQQLRQHGNPVYTQMIPDIMSLFYQEPPTEKMATQIEQMSTKIRPMLPLLAKHPMPAQPVALGPSASLKSGIDVSLKEFGGGLTPMRIDLPDTSGNQVIKDDFSGQVTLINFWATWCPPCIEEIPSLNRLRAKMKGLPFELISINYAEDQSEIQSFLNKVKVEFPVLLDREGGVAHEWNVITYPSTFVVDADGVIRYGVNAAIEWDDPEVVEKLRALLPDR